LGEVSSDERTPPIFPQNFPLHSHQINVIVPPFQVIFLKVWEKSSLIGIGNNPMVGMTVSTAVSIEEAAKAGKF